MAGHGDTVALGPPPGLWLIDLRFNKIFDLLILLRKLALLCHQSELLQLG